MNNTDPAPEGATPHNLGHVARMLRIKAGVTLRELGPFVPKWATAEGDLWHEQQAAARVLGELDRTADSCVAMVKFPNDEVREAAEAGNHDLANELWEQHDASELFAALATTGPCGEPDCHDGYVHEDGEVSLCSACSKSDDGAADS